MSRGPEWDRAKIPSLERQLFDPSNFSVMTIGFPISPETDFILLSSSVPPGDQGRWKVLGYFILNYTTFREKQIKTVSI